MASVEAGVPSTVRQHYRQLLDETLNERPPNRLIEDLTFVLDEVSDQTDKAVFRGFLTAVLEKRLIWKDDQIALAVLVRPHGVRDSNDWAPFLEGVDEFERAEIPATVLFISVVCDCSFSELMNRVKRAATASRPEGN